MATRLTKALREQILENVMKATDYEAKVKDLAQRTSDVVRALLATRIPVEFTEATKGKPKDWFCATSTYHLGAMSPENYARLDAKYRAHAQFDPLLHPANNCELRLTKEEIVAHIDPLCEEGKAICKHFESLRGEMNAFLNSCTTVEKILERMPELEPHIPKQEQFFAPTVSTSNLLSHLMKSGFVVQEGGAVT